MVVYSLLSHSTDLLPVHLAAFRAFLPVSRFVVVQGPFGANAFTSAGRVRLQAEDAERLGVELLDAPAMVLGLSPPARIAAIMDWIWEDRFVNQDEQHAVITHGDLLPTRKMQPGDLLHGSAMATRAHRINNRTICPLTWLAADIGLYPSGVKPSTIADFMHDTKGWDARPAFSSDIPIPDYDPSLHFEWCEPGFLHIDKLSFSTAMPDLHARKMEAVKRIMAAMGVSVPDVGPLGETLGGLENHAPRIAGILHGAAGLAKAALGINRADDATIDRRKAACAACEHSGRSMGVVTCSICRCALAAKTVNADEHCPVGKW